MSKGKQEGKSVLEDNNEVKTAKGFLRWVEIIGNKLPHPFWLFVWICVIIVLVSGISAYFNVEAIQPGNCSKNCVIFPPGPAPPGSRRLEGGAGPCVIYIVGTYLHNES